MRSLRDKCEVAKQGGGRERYKRTKYLLQFIGVVGCVGVDVLRYRAYLPLLHGLWAGGPTVSSGA